MGGFLFTAPFTLLGQLRRLQPSSSLGDPSFSRWFHEFKMNALFNRHCLNYKGKGGIHFSMKLACEYKGVLEKVLLPVCQIYERFDADSTIQVNNERLNYFTKKIFPKIKDSVQGRHKSWSLPEQNVFYPQIMNMLKGSHDMMSTMLFSRFDLLKLEMIVGSASAKRMINSEKNIFAFC